MVEPKSIVKTAKQKGERWLPILLAILALADLRTELRLLFEHFTFTALIFAIRHHTLAVLVLMATPSLLRRYSSKKE